MAIANLLIKIGADISELKTEMNKATGAVESFTGRLGSFGKTVQNVFAGAFAISTVTAFAEHVISVAGEINDMSAALGISTTAVQQFKFAAEQSGGTIDDVGRALNFMNKTLAVGDKSTVNALADAGLSLRDIRNMKPEDAFLAITDAVRKIEDPMQRARVEQELFGKGAIALAPAIAAGFRDVAKAATTMSEDTIKRLDEAGDQIDRFKNRLVIAFGEMLGDLSRGPDITQEFRVALDKLGLSAAAAAKAPPPPLLTPAGAKQISLSEKELAEVNKTLDEQRKALDQTAQKQKAHADQIARLRDELTGRGGIKAAKDMIEALRGINLTSELSAEQTKRVNDAMGAAIETYQRFGETAPEAIRLTFIETTRLQPAVAGLVGEFENVGQKLDKFTIPKLIDASKLLDYVAGIPFGTNIGQEIDIIPPKLHVATVNLTDLSRSFAELAQVSHGTFGGIAQGLAGMISSINAGRQSFGTLKDGLANWKGGSTWEGVLGMTSGIAGIASAAITAIGLIGKLFDRNKGRDLVVDFAANLGGFDALHNALLEGGDAGEQLWIKLTQGVGRNNPEQAKQVIAEVQAFLDKLSNTVATPQIIPQVTWPGGEPPDETPGYATGTRGAYVNFGAGTLAMLHGNERIMTENEDVGGGDIYISIGNRAVNDYIVNVTRRDAARGGLVTSGRPRRRY